jgi:hypothetical protein
MSKAKICAAGTGARPGFAIAALIAAASATTQAEAESVVVEQFKRVVASTGKPIPPDNFPMFQIFEELDTIKLDEYMLFPLQKEEHRWGLDHDVYLLKNPIARQQVCDQVQRSILQMGPLAFTLTTLGEEAEYLGDAKTVTDFKITAEAVVAYHILKAKFECASNPEFD